MQPIRQLDLHHLLVLEALLVERSVTRAARRLGVTQPAVSNALVRMRAILGDELFIRGAGGMVATAYALQMEGPLTLALQQIRIALQPAEFVPARSVQMFRLAMSSHAELTVLPLLATRLAKIAPSVGLHVKPKPTPEIPQQLDTREIDFAIGATVLPPKRFRTMTLYGDEYVCIMRADHPMAAKRFAAEDFAAARQVQISPTGATSNLLDDLLARRGLRRQAAITVNDFTPGLKVVAETDMVTAIFRRSFEVLQEFAPRGLICRPLNLDPVEVAMVWHAELGNHADCEWLRGQIYDVCAPFRPAQPVMSSQRRKARAASK